MKIIEGIKPELSTEKINRQLGYRKSKKISRRLEKRVDSFIDHSYQLIAPRVLYTEKEIMKRENGDLMLEGSISLSNGKISKALRKCGRVGAFLVTIGNEMDKKIKTCMDQKRMSDAYLYDTIGSVAVEETVEKFQNLMDNRLKEKQKMTTLRFSPGYCDWQMQDQDKLFQILKGKRINVELLSNNFMTPRKSVSGIFGIGDIKDIAKRNTNPCKICGLDKCIARRSES